MEIVHGYNSNNVDPSGMLKVHLRKSFDTQRWDFVIATLRAINVSDIYINLIHSYQHSFLPSQLTGIRASLIALKGFVK